MPKLSRRTAFQASGAALAMIALAGKAHAHAGEKGPELTAAEKANLKVVDDYLKSFEDPKADTAALIRQYMAASATVRFSQDLPIITGVDKIIEAMKGFTAKGERYEIKTVRSLVKGPIVVNDRLDSTFYPDGKKTGPDPVVGIFLVKDGKIQEWFDYVAKA